MRRRQPAPTQPVAVFKRRRGPSYQTSLAASVAAVTHQASPRLVVTEVAANPGVLVRVCSNAAGQAAQERDLDAFAVRLAALGYRTTWQYLGSMPQLYVGR